jgi:sulfofructose kinase
MCVGLGLCALDYTFQVQEYPRLDDKIEAAAFTRQGGGPVPTALCALSKLGVPSAFIGKCGKDVEGRAIRDELRRFGVNTSGLILDPDSRTPRAFIMVDKESGKRTVILDRTETSALSADEFNVDFIRRAKFLLIDGRELETSLTAAMLMQKTGGEVILDAGSPRKNIGDILPYVDHLVVSNRFSIDFTQEVDPGNAALKLAHMGFKSVVITSGAKGCLGATSDGLFYQQEAFDVEVVDTTGAGDVFHGGYIYGLVQGWELPKILEFASAVAAIKCTRLGGRRGIPELEEVEDLINKKELV